MSPSIKETLLRCQIVCVELGPEFDDADVGNSKVERKFNKNRFFLNISKELQYITAREKERWDQKYSFHPYVYIPKEDLIAKTARETKQKISGLLVDW
ncbi:hypothetical protein IM40_01520 [Candidatus Paracaedimonas acanthamoebae]|nr:hypothetical protein IM40_01520 [Candidatus Paracaedimonas acanthamoebae]